MSWAVDELERLRAENELLRDALAYEARVVEAQTLDLKSLAKCRRDALERQVARMRTAATGTVRYAYAHVSRLGHERAALLRADGEVAS